MEQYSSLYYLSIIPLGETPRPPCIEQGCPRDATWVIAQGVGKEPLFAYAYCGEHMHAMMTDMAERRQKMRKLETLNAALGSGRPLILTVMLPDGGDPVRLAMYPPYSRNIRGYVYGRNVDGTTVFIHEDFILAVEVQP